MCLSAHVIFSVQHTFIGSEIFLFYKSSIYLIISWEYPSPVIGPLRRKHYTVSLSLLPFVPNPGQLLLCGHRVDEVHQPSCSQTARLAWQAVKHWTLWASKTQPPLYWPGCPAVGEGLCKHILYSRSFLPTSLFFLDTGKE